MSRSYKFRNEEGLYFVSFATVGWVDVFTRLNYKNILIDSLQYCQKEKGLLLYSWCIMSSHVHLIIQAKEGFKLSDIIRDFKKFTSKSIINAIEENQQESRKEWMLTIFKNSDQYNSNNSIYQFWQQHNKPIELYSPRVIQQKLDYIHNNSVKEGWVMSPEEYLFSSAKNYNCEKGLLEIESL